MNILDIVIIAAVAFLPHSGHFQGDRSRNRVPGRGRIGHLAGQRLSSSGGIVSEKPSFRRAKYLPLVAFALIFLLVLVLGNLLGWLFKKLFQKLFLGWVDRMLGACLALLKGILLSYLFIVVVTFLAPRDSALVTQSRLAPMVVSAYRTLVGLIPKGSHEKLKRSFDKQKQNLESIYTGKI